MLRRKERKGIIILSLSLYFLFSMMPSRCFASQYTLARVINDWRVGSPHEPIHIEASMFENERSIENVTLFYSFNNTDQWYKDLMSIKSGDEITGTWEYTFSEQPNGTVLWFYEKIFFQNGDVMPHHITEDTWVKWQVYKPKYSSMRISYFHIKNIDEKKLQADIKVTFELVEPFDVSSRPIRLENHLGESWLSDSRYFSINHSESRYTYYGQVELSDLDLSGDSTKFPYDNYYLWLEFEGPGIDETSIDVVNINLNAKDSYIWKKGQYEEVLENQEAKIMVTLERRTESRIWFEIPLTVFLLILASTFVFKPSEIRHRLSIFTSSIFYFFTFNGVIRNFTPERATGICFAEIFIPYFALFATGYLIASIINYAFYEQFAESLTEEKAFVTGMMIDLFVIALPLVYMLLIPVLKNENEVLMLYNIMPRNLYSLIYALPAGGLLVRFIFYWLHTRHKPHRQSLLDDFTMDY